MKKIFALLFLLGSLTGSVFAVDFPLTAHITACEVIAFDKSCASVRAARVEATVEGTTYILDVLSVRGFTIIVGSDYAARRANHQRRDSFQLMVPNREGKLKPHWFGIIGKREAQ